MGLCFASELYLPKNNLYYDKLLLILIKKLEPNKENLNKLKNLKRQNFKTAFINLDYHFELEINKILSNDKLTPYQIQDLHLKKNLLFKDVLMHLHHKWKNYNYEIEEVYDFSNDKICYYLTWI